MKIFKVATVALLSTIFAGGCAKGQIAGVQKNVADESSPAQYTDADLVWSDDFNGTKLDAKNWNYGAGSEDNFAFDFELLTDFDISNLLYNIS